MDAYLFRCVNPGCQCEEVRTEKEVPWGEPLQLRAYCDYCNSDLRYVGEVGPNYMVRVSPDN